MYHVFECLYCGNPRSFEDPPPNEYDGILWAHTITHNNMPREEFVIEDHWHVSILDAVETQES